MCGHRLQGELVLKREGVRSRAPGTEMSDFDAVAQEPTLSARLVRARGNVSQQEPLHEPKLGCAEHEYANNAISNDHGYTREITQAVELCERAGLGETLLSNWNMQRILGEYERMWPGYLPLATQGLADKGGNKRNKRARSAGSKRSPSPLPP